MRLVAALLLFVAIAAGAWAEDSSSDPLKGLEKELTEQDRAVDTSRGDAAVAAARQRAKDGTPESYYLLGRMLGLLAVKKLDAKQEPEASRLLDEARDNFEKAREAGGLLFAPAHLGLARVAHFHGDLDGSVNELRQALRISKGFKEAAIDLAKTLWEKRLPGDAEYVLYQFLGERPNDSDARLLLGMLKIQRKRYAEAEPEFRSVLEADPSSQPARKFLAACLMYQEKWAESAEQWEMLRRMDPKDDESYNTLFHLYRQMKQKDKAIAVLRALVDAMPGTEAATRAKARLDELAANPAAWDAVADDSPEALVKSLDSPDPAVVLQTLERMREFKWPALPSGVYRLFEKTRAAPVAHRLAAVRLVAEHRDPQTLTILEILLLHPEERERDLAVRKEVAHAISTLPTAAVVPILFEVLSDPDGDVRERAVEGIAARTGKWFRADLSVRTEDKDWPQELELYRKWWASPSASAGKRAAVKALSETYGPVQRGSKSRVARYALPAMEDPIEETWRAGYDLFRALTFHTFGSETGSVAPPERARIAREARAWLDAELRRPK